MKNGKCLYCDTDLKVHGKGNCQKMSDGSAEKNKITKSLRDIQYYADNQEDHVIYRRLLLDLLLDFGYEDNKEKEIKRAFTAGYSWGHYREVEDCYLDWKKDEENLP